MGAEAAVVCRSALRGLGEELLLVVEDDGVGCASDAQGNLVSRLVELLAKQLKGEIRREPVQPGCRVVTRFEHSSVEGTVPARAAGTDVVQR